MACSFLCVHFPGTLGPWLGIAMAAWPDGPIKVCLCCLTVCAFAFEKAALFILFLVLLEPSLDPLLLGGAFL